MDESSYDRLVALIYGAATDDARWHDVLQAVSTATDGVRPYLFGHDFKLRQSVNVIAELDPDWVARYEQDYVSMNPLAAAAATATVGQTVRKSDIWPVEKMRASVFYNEWMRPQDDLWGGSGTVLFRQADRFFAFGGFVRRRDTDRLEDEWFALCHRLTPHLRQAAEISRTLGATRLPLPGAGGLISASTPAAILVSPELTVLWQNEDALAQMMSGTVMGWDMHGRLALRDAQAQAALVHLAQQLRLQQSPKALSMASSGSSIVRMVALPPPERLRLPMTFLLGRDEPVILVTLTGPIATRDANLLLRRSFGLTTAEADVALALFEGLSPTEIAERREVSPLTVRSQVKTVLAKTEAARQSDLVRKLSDLLRG